MRECEGDVVHALDHRVRRDPRGVVRPTVDVGWIEQALPHARPGARDGLRHVCRSKRTRSVNHELDRRLQQRAVARISGELWAGQHRAHQRLHVVLAAAKCISQPIHQGRRRLPRHEVLQHPGGDEWRGGRLGQDAIDDALGVQRAGLAEVRDRALERAPLVEYAGFLAGVDGEHAAGAVGGSGRVRARQLPAGQRKGPLAHVLFGEGVGAHREELHELARIVLVGARCDRRREVEVTQHRRVGGDLHEHRAQVGHRHAPPGEVLPVHECVVGRLAVVACEVAVPEERHALGERGRRAEHVVDPPLLELGDRETTARSVCGREGRRFSRRRFDQPIDGLVESVGQRGVELRRCVAEARSPQQMHHARRLGFQGRDPVRRRARARRGDVLHRPAQEANHPHTDAGGDRGAERLPPGDATSLCRGAVGLVVSWCEAHELIQARQAAVDIRWM